MTREQEIIKSFIEGKPAPPTIAKTATVRDEPESTGTFRLQSMDAIEQRKAQETAIEKARSERSGPVDKNAMRRDILGPDRMAKARARSQFQSKNSARIPYVKVADRR